MDLLFASSFVAIPNSFILASYNAVFSQNVMPHLYSAPASITAPMFTKVYYMGAKTIAPIAASAILAYGYLSYSSTSSLKRSLYATSAVLTFGTLVYTQTLMRPVITRLIELGGNNKLLQEAATNQEVTTLIKNWVAQNSFRASLHMTAGVLGMYALLSHA